MAGTNKNDYELQGYIIFIQAVQNAYSLDKNASYEEVEAAKSAVKEAYENLIKKENA